MLVKNTCQIHNTQNKNVSERFTKEKFDEQGRVINTVVTTEYDYNDLLIPPRLPEIDASNLRLYTIIGIILG